MATIYNYTFGGKGVQPLGVSQPGILLRLVTLSNPGPKPLRRRGLPSYHTLRTPQAPRGAQPGDVPGLLLLMLGLCEHRSFLLLLGCV